jgi:hypothetical protein
MIEFGVVDLSNEATEGRAIATLGRAPVVNLDRMRAELEEVRDALQPLIAQADASDKTHFGLRELELKLTVGIEGSILFVAKGSADASITLKFSR